MTKHKTIEKHIYTIDELTNIMVAMKNLATIEINKVTRFINTQNKVNNTIQTVGQDFLSQYPEYHHELTPDIALVIIMIGSERGFCGGFNETLIEEVQSHIMVDSKLIVIGNKLAEKMQDEKRIIRTFAGADTTDEIQTVIAHLIRFLDDANINPSQWAIAFHHGNDGPFQTVLLRPFEEFKTHNQVQYAYPPTLHQSKNTFLFEFINHYLLSLLYQIFNQSFMTECSQRLKHLQGAIERFEKENASLKVKMNLLRQAEITDEIEVMMLNTQIMAKEILATTK